MKNLKYRSFGLFSIVLMIFFIIGCASEPIKVNWPANHPTNPEAQEAKFMPPPNPFQEDVTAMQRESTPDSMMKHKMHEEGSQPHSGHNMGTDKEGGSNPESTKKSGHGEDDNQHKGHGQ